MLTFYILQDLLTIDYAYLLEAGYGGLNTLPKNNVPLVI